MTKISRNFIAGKMNKVVDERLLPEGQYVDAMNIRMGSTENSEIGVIENTKGNKALTSLLYIDGTPLSINARCIGALEDSENETIYWFVHDPSFQPNTPPIGSGKLDLIVSYNVFTGLLVYHVISVKAPGSVNATTLNFSSSYLITGVNKIGDLLFFTDDYNDPRFINVKKAYPVPIANVDQFSAESIMVLKRPPTEAPIVTPVNTSGQENFMEDRFLCFAYRYKYANGEYSATSQWSEPCFVPKSFSLDLTSYLNAGMQNESNAADIQYNSGSDLVVGIDILFKQMGSNTINLIERIDKAEAGIPDNAVMLYSFSNSKVLTVLPESELLRLYDNVPRKAKAQTLMGNRIMYGNYLEGYDLVDKFGFNTRIDYYTDLVSSQIGVSQGSSSFGLGSYLFASPAPPVITYSKMTVDLSSIFSQYNGVLPANSVLDITFSYIHSTWYSPSGSTLPSGTQPTQDVTFSVTLNSSYSSVNALLSSVEFQEAVGLAGTVLPVYSSIPGPTSTDGNTFTDSFNASVTPAYSIPLLPSGQSNMDKFWSGYGGSLPNPSLPPTSPDIFSFSVVNTTTFTMQLPAMAYADSLTTPTYYAIEFFKYIAASVDFYNVTQSKSLHSNRGYEVGIVYMDEFGRSSNVLTSLNNTIHVPCGNSPDKNSIKVTIPTTQVAPTWASRYKFVCRADRENYETIYAFIYYNDDDTGESYFLLEGENSAKIEVGDRLIVKADTNGALLSCVYATVLDKKSFVSGTVPGSNSASPEGVYMKIKPENFSTVKSQGETINLGSLYTAENNGGDYPIQEYLVNKEISPGVYQDIDIPAGSTISLYFKFERQGVGCPCEKRIYTLDIDVRASRNYLNFYDFWVGENVAGLLNSGVGETSCGASLPNNSFIAGPNVADPTPSSGTNYFWFKWAGGLTDPRYLKTSGTVRCTGVAKKSQRRSSITTQIIITKADDACIFETEPTDTIPDIFFENERSYPIDPVTGSHLSNYPGDTSQNIGTGTNGIIYPNFFNCYSFGNGVESYKILDSLIGRTMNLGNRVNSVSSKEYGAVRRYADITYSGIYNEESNVNRLNEFNLGLLNFKNLEASFGNIYILDGRQTDVLALQEDKISYVLAGKNLLSDAAAGGAITSVPEVLGTQIARSEKYGISFNPESYVQWGYDRFFTDVKRGVVLQLRGDSYSNEQLKVVSEFGMRTWFRDTFINSFNKQKLGGFDPYMNEYVLSGNEIDLPEQVECVACGLTQTFTLDNNTGKSSLKCFCVDFGQVTGPVTVNYNITAKNWGPFDSAMVYVLYNGNYYSSGAINTLGPGSFTFTKNSNVVNTAQVCINYPNGDTVMLLNVGCPVPEPLTIIEVVYTGIINAGDTIHTEYYYYNPSYIAALQSNQVVFSGVPSSPIVSRYNLISGYVGTAGFPAAGDTMRLRTNQIVPDNFIFDPLNNKFMYLRSNTLYGNNPVDMNALSLAALNAVPISGSSPMYYADFTVPPTSNGQYLYLIWDLRVSTAVDLCYTETTSNEYEICCQCTKCIEECVELQLTNQSSVNSATIVFPSGTCENPYVSATIELDPSEIGSICVINDSNWYISQGNATVQIKTCGCTSECLSNCETWTIVPTSGVGSPEHITVEYRSCVTGNMETVDLSVDRWHDLCIERGSTPDITAGVAITYTTQDCGCCSSQPCWQVEVYNNGTVGSVSVQYYDCEGNFQSILLPPDPSDEFNSLVICVNKSYPAPVVTASIGTRYGVVPIDACSCSRPLPGG